MADALHGILILNKPAGISSAGALNQIKRLVPREKRLKIGHAGTLDPFATGVLLVLLGKATKLSQTLMGLPKRYRATIKFGATTPTLDPTSDIIPCFSPSSPPDIETLRRVIASQFTGTIQQTPPAYSALKRDGRPLYHYARKGVELELKPRPVVIYGMEIISYQYPLLELDVHCGKGTYIRSLARDIALALNTSGYLAALCRTAVGEYQLDQAVDLERITLESLASRILPV